MKNMNQMTKKERERKKKRTVNEKVTKGEKINDEDEHKETHNE